MIEIEARAVAARFGETTVLEGVDFTARIGEMIGLIGANGSGKTTLLKILAGLRDADAGSVRYSGKTASETGRTMLARRIAYLAQGGNAHWPMQVETLVGLGRLPYRRQLQEFDAADREAVGEAMVAADVVPLRSRTMAELSGGERMRVLLARALAVRADVLLADEPTAALDPLHQLQVMDLLRRTTRRGAGVIVVIHDLTLAMRFCDRLVLLAQGGVLADGTPKAVLTNANIERAYGIEVVRGERQGIPYLLPWAPIGGLEGKASDEQR